MSKVSLHISKNSTNAIETFYKTAVKKIKTDSSATLLDSFCGHFINQDTERLTSVLEGHLHKKNYIKKHVKSAFSTAVEMIQNIRLHGSRIEQKTPGCYITFSEGSSLSIQTANLISNAEVPVLIQRISDLKSLQNTQLKQRYIDRLAKGSISLKGGAGLGLLTILSKCNGKISTKFVNISNEYSIFSMTTTLPLEHA